MESYMLVLYVTLQQEEEIRHLFYKRGWKFMKEEAEVSIRQDGSQENLLHSDKIVTNEGENHVYLELSCLSGHNAKSSSNADTSFKRLSDSVQLNTVVNEVQDTDSITGLQDGYTVNNIQGTDSVTSLQDCCIVNDVRATSSLTGLQEGCIVNDVQYSDSVTNLQDGCIVNDEDQNSFSACLEDDRLLTQDSNVENDFQDSTSNSDGVSAKISYKDENATENTSVVENHTFVTEDNVKKNKHAETFGEQEQNSREQLKNLISAGKLLSIENKKELRNGQTSVREKIKTSLKGTGYPVKSSKKKTIFCSDCKSTFHYQKSYDNHKSRNNGQCVFQCQYCDKVFLHKKSRYDIHIRSAHSKERPFKCDVCQKGYVTSDKLKIHKRVHTGEKPCVCEECGKMFYSKGELSTHRNYHHVSKEGRADLKCDMCNMTFCNSRYLVYHKNVVHSTRRDFHCQTCFKSYKTSYSLNRHLKYIHSELKKFKCDTCDKSFKTPGSLRKHKERHTGKRTYFCRECGKGFYEKVKLEQHFRTHTGEKPHQCHLCDYRCAVPGNLKKHMKTHSRELSNR